jgi:hypothetical protein
MPDSSGIIYTRTDWPGGREDLAGQHKGRLIHYDLKENTKRVIAETLTNTIQPAVSPDGKRIAVAGLNLRRGMPATLEVIVYDFHGKVDHRSETFDWGEKPTSEVSIERYPQLFWAPAGDKVLLFANRTTGIYQISNGQMVTLVDSMPMICGTTPIRPDGKGFLISRGDNRAFFVDWDGKESPIAVEVGKLSNAHPSVLAAPAASYWTQWDGHTAVITWKGCQLRIETDKKSSSVHKLDKAGWAWDHKEIQHLYAFPDGNAKVAVVYLKSFRDFRDAGLPTVRVDFAGPEPNQRRTLIPETHHCGVYPSPNKELVALRYQARQNDQGDNHQDMILVLNRKGEIITRFETGK